MLGAVYGVADSVLPDFAGGNIFDEISTVTVNLLYGELSSDTEANVLNGYNLALLGDELIHFKNAELVSDNVYILSGLLRGLRGTDWAMETHAEGDQFILLTPDTVKIMHGAAAEYNMVRLYKAGSFGSRLQDTYVEFTHTAVARKCLSPCQLGGGRKSDGAINFTWVRRDRLGFSWIDSDAPMSETTEAYELVIYSDNTYTTVTRTVTGITSPTYEYTAADQVTDFGIIQNPVYWEVFQISSVTNRGYGARGVL
jgi:hypothetical protein